MSVAASLASTDPHYVDVVGAVLDEVLRPRWPQAVWDFGPLEVNDFSFCIAGERRDGGEPRGVYIKVPKRRIATATLGEIGEEDRAFGAREHASLELLARAWPGVGVRYVELLGRIGRLNALVTRRIYGQDFSVWLRGEQASSSPKAVEALKTVGRSLAAFHASQAGQTFADETRLAAKFVRYGEQLRAFGVDPRALDAIVRLGSAGAISAGCRYLPFTTTLKGLDVRNLLLEPEGGLVFLDPGAAKLDSPLADVARFSATLRLLYWGKLSFFLGRTARPEYMRAFENGYFGGSAPEAAQVYELKELCKMWLMAHVALRAKRWPGIFKLTLRQFYVDRYFTNWLNELEDNAANG